MLLKPRTTTLDAWSPWVMMSTPGAKRRCSAGVVTGRSSSSISPTVKVVAGASVSFSAALEAVMTTGSSS